MDTKISSTFWSDPAIENMDAKQKLAILWLLTNERITLCGYVEISSRRFSFETGLDAVEIDRAVDAHPMGISRVGKGILLRNFIRHQFGNGKRLTSNTMSYTICNQLVALPAEVSAEVLKIYPELSKRFHDIKAQAEHIPTPGGGGGLREGEGEGEGEREGEREKGKGAGKGKRRRGQSVDPRELDLPLGDRLLRVGRILRRQDSTRWSAEELEAFKAAGLDAMSAEDFDAQLAPLAQYYAAPIPIEKDFRRRDVLRLIRHWSGELDRARAYVRNADDGLQKL